MGGRTWAGAILAGTRDRTSASRDAAARPADRVDRDIHRLCRPHDITDIAARGAPSGAGARRHPAHRRQPARADHRGRPAGRADPRIPGPRRRAGRPADHPSAAGLRAGLPRRGAVCGPVRAGAHAAGRTGPDVRGHRPALGRPGMGAVRGDGPDRRRHRCRQRAAAQPAQTGLPAAHGPADGGLRRDDDRGGGPGLGRGRSTGRGVGRRLDARPRGRRGAAAAGGPALARAGPPACRRRRAAVSRGAAPFGVAGAPGLAGRGLPGPDLPHPLRRHRMAAGDPAGSGCVRRTRRRAARLDAAGRRGARAGAGATAPAPARPALDRLRLAGARRMRATGAGAAATTGSRGCWRGPSGLRSGRSPSAWAWAPRWC